MTTPSFAFSCQWDSHGSTEQPPFNLCFNNGTCDPTTNFTSCICPANYGHDFMLFHDPNCALLGGVYLYLLIASSLGHVPLIILLLFMLFWPGYNTARHERILLKWMVLSITGAWIFCLATYVEYGCYEVSLLGLGTALTSFGMCADSFIRYLFISLYLSLFDGRKRAQEFKTNLERIRMVMCVFAVVLLISTMSTVRWYPRIYNIIVSLAMFFVAGVNLVYSTIFLFNTRVMHQQLAQLKLTVVALPKDAEMQETYDRWVVLERKLSQVTFVALAYGVMFLFGPLPLPIVHYVLQSVPYQWAYTITALTCHTLAFVSMIHFLVRKTLPRSMLVKRDEEEDVHHDGNSGGGGGGGGGGAVGEEKLDRAMVSPMRAMFGKRTDSSLEQTKSSMEKTKSSMESSLRNTLSAWSSRGDAFLPPSGRNLTSTTTSPVDANVTLSDKEG